MVTVTDITTVRSAVCLHLDSGVRIWLKKQDMADSGLAEGSVLEEEELYRFVRLCQYPRALNQAVAMLARRPCSKAEIERKLLASHYLEDVTELVLYKLEKENLVNDRDFCEQWIRYRTGGQYGPRRIVRELKSKGIPEDLAQEILDQVSAGDEDGKPVSLALRAWKKKAGSREDIRKARQKVTAFLVRRGFDWDTARKACEAAEKMLEEDV